MVFVRPLVLAVCNAVELLLAFVVMCCGDGLALLRLAIACPRPLPSLPEFSIATHPILSFDEAEVKRILEIPDDYRVVITTPLAYPAEPSYDEAAVDKLGARTRKEPREIIFFGTWGLWRRS